MTGGSDDGRSGGEGSGKKRAANRGSWKLGQCGNPRGRPPKPVHQSQVNEAEPLRDIVHEEASRVVTISDGTRMIDVPCSRAFIRKIFIDAIKGQPAAQRICLALMKRFDVKDTMTTEDLSSLNLDECDVGRLISHPRVWEHLTKIISDVHTLYVSVLTPEQRVATRESLEQLKASIKTVNR